MQDLVAKCLFIASMCTYFTYKDIHKHIQCQSVLLSSLAKPCSDFLAVLLNKSHNLLHIFGNISHLVLLHTRIFKHSCSIRNGQVGLFFVMNTKRKWWETIPTLGLAQLSQLTSECSLQKLLLNFSSPKYASSWILLHSIVFSQKCTMLFKLLKWVALACLSPSLSTVIKNTWLHNSYIQLDIWKVNMPRMISKVLRIDGDMRQK